MKPVIILGIESSCDDTSAAVVRDGVLITNIMAGQEVHGDYGGVVPELASRAHQQHIVPVVHQALKKAGVAKKEVSAVAFTQGPGLLGSLMVGSTFAKAFALSLDIPVIAVNHLMGHVLSLFIQEPGEHTTVPQFPYLCLLVSGGHTQIMLVQEQLRMKTLGKTIDDAAGEAFDKCGKVMGLPYPAGPLIDKLALQGDPDRFTFSRSRVPGLDFSFSGLKTSFLYFLRDALKEDPGFIVKHQSDLAASLQKTIISMLMEKLRLAAYETGIKNIGIAGGVAANSGLREALSSAAGQEGWKVFIPHRRYTTDNAAMIAITGYYKYLEGDFAGQDTVPMARMPL